ncbi:hypothetical protein ACFWIW_28150 [Amycolatopsis sp. NPDC058340]|uniref:hypothetical protein n=1 Tax=Amycolatopsis sp. NPDC058340 TaxID=3346453 RepID=UPI0036538819
MLIIAVCMVLAFLVYKYVGLNEWGIGLMAALAMLIGSALGARWRSEDRNRSTSADE